MNHNIRYELRPKYDLDFSIEISKATGLTTIGPDSVGVSGLDVRAMVYNIDKRLWWYNSAAPAVGPAEEWTHTYPDPALIGTGAVDDPEFFQRRMVNPIQLSGLGFPPFPFEGVYFSSEFTIAHDKLETGNGFDPVSGIPIPPGAGTRGYLVYITADLTAFGGGVVTEYIHLAPIINDVNVVSWRGNPVTNSTTGFPDVNVADWGSNNAVLDVDGIGNIPDVNIERYKDELVSSTVAGKPDVNLTEILGAVNPVTELEDFAINGYDSVTSQVEGVKEVDLIGAAGIRSTSFDIKAIEEAALDTGAISARVIATDAIDADAIAANAIDADAIADGAIDEPAFADSAISARVIATDAVDADAIAANAIDADAIADGAIDEPAFADNAISARVIATDAIDEDAIKIDSVTYEEISDSAVREIVSGIWNASVFGPIDYSLSFDGSNYGLANAGTMGHAMLTTYLTKHISHASNHISPTSSPLHTSKLSDPSGTKFYSKLLDSTPLIEPDETKSYIDRSAVIFKGLNSDGSVDVNSQHHLVRISGVNVDADGQYFEIHLMDEDGSSVPGGITAEATIGPLSLGDILVVKAETDATMHEVAHEVWEEPVADHSTPDTFGMLNRIIAGLSQYNHQITDSKYDPSGRLLSCRLVVYPTSDDARNGTNALTTIEVSSSYDEKQNMVSFASAEEK